MRTSFFIGGLLTVLLAFIVVGIPTDTRDVGRGTVVDKSFEVAQSGSTIDTNGDAGMVTVAAEYVFIVELTDSRVLSVETNLQRYGWTQIGEPVFVVAKTNIFGNVISHKIVEEAEVEGGE